MAENHILEFTDEKWQELLDAARERGFASVQDYLLALHDTVSSPEGEDDEIDPEASFRQGLREALRGEKGIPYDDLWKMLDRD